MPAAQNSPEVWYLDSKYEDRHPSDIVDYLGEYKLKRHSALFVLGKLVSLLFLTPATMLALLAFAVPSVFGVAVRQASTAPTVNVKNGTYTGVHSPTYNEDFFLGIPFAQPPIGDLRLQLPQPLNETWSEPRSAQQYYPECVGYGGDQIGYEVSEDCLALNVVRPAGYEGQKLPVAFWIHGGESSSSPMPAPEIGPNPL